MKDNKQKLSAKETEELLKTLKNRFEKNKHLHKGIDWAKVEAKLKGKPEKLWSLDEMESSGGEPDVVGFDKKTGEYIFYDCSAESPKGRRSFCYDRKALDARKEHKPKNNAIDMATAMGVELLTEEEYRQLQQLGEFDTKTSSWVKTPDRIRKLGGAIFSSLVRVPTNHFLNSKLRKQIFYKIKILFIHFVILGSEIFVIAGISNQLPILHQRISNDLVI